MLRSRSLHARFDRLLRSNRSVGMTSPKFPPGSMVDLTRGRFHDNTYFEGSILTLKLGEKSTLSATGMRAESSSPPLEEMVDPSAYVLPPGPESLADRIAIARIRTRRFLASAFHESVRASQRVLIELRKRVGQMKDERPMDLLGLIAGSALVLGITLRIGRSRR